MEFIKEPHDIDAAVYQAVCFHETRHKQRRADTANMRHMTDYDDKGGNSEDEEVARVAPGKHKHRLIENDNKTRTQPGVNLEEIRQLVKTELLNLSHSHTNTPADQKTAQPTTNRGAYTHSQQFLSQDRRNQNYPPLQKVNGNAVNQQNRGCFNCGELSHFKRDCPKLINRQGPPNKVGSWVNQGLNYPGLAQEAKGQSEPMRASVNQGLMNQ